MALSDEVRFFDENQDKLRAQYPDRFVVVKDGAVVSDHETFKDAYDAAIQAGLTGFLIRHVDYTDVTQNFIHIN